MAIPNTTKPTLQQVDRVLKDEYNLTFLDYGNYFAEIEDTFGLLVGGDEEDNITLAITTDSSAEALGSTITTYTFSELRKMIHYLYYTILALNKRDRKIQQTTMLTDLPVIPGAKPVQGARKNHCC